MPRGWLGFERVFMDTGMLSHDVLPCRVSVCIIEFRGMRACACVPEFTCARMSVYVPSELLRTSAASYRRCPRVRLATQRAPFKIDADIPSHRRKASQRATKQRRQSSSSSRQPGSQIYFSGIDVCLAFVTCWRARVRVRIGGWRRTCVCVCGWGMECIL